MHTVVVSYAMSKASVQRLWNKKTKSVNVYSWTDIFHVQELDETIS